MNVLFIINDPAYGSEQPFNAFRLAGTMAPSATTSTWLCSSWATP